MCRVIHSSSSLNRAARPLLTSATFFTIIGPSLFPITRSRPTTNLFFFFFNDTATTEIYTLSLHDALPISQALVEVARGDDELVEGLRRRLGPRQHREQRQPAVVLRVHGLDIEGARPAVAVRGDRKSTRLNSSHDQISYAVFCLKKKNRHAALPRRPRTVRSRHRCLPTRPVTRSRARTRERLPDGHSHLRHGDRRPAHRAAAPRA